MGLQEAMASLTILKGGSHQDAKALYINRKPANAHIIGERDRGGWRLEEPSMSMQDEGWERRGCPTHRIRVLIEFRMLPR
eukprot:scaffold269831_cov27-Tisochrysis_lutea.AAC.3